MAKRIPIDLHVYAKHISSALPSDKHRQADYLYLRTVLLKLAKGLGMSPSCIRDQYVPQGKQLTDASLAWLTQLSEMLEGNEPAFKTWLVTEFPNEKVSILMEDLAV